jgi:hypothetical protein
MTVTHRSRRTAYDNIAAGSATGKERTVRGDAGVTELYGGGYGTGSTDSIGKTNIKAGVTDFGPENMTVGVDPTDDALATSDHAGFTS